MFTVSLFDQLLTSKL